MANRPKSPPLEARRCVMTRQGLATESYRRVT